MTKLAFAFWWYAWWKIYPTFGWVDKLREYL